MDDKVYFKERNVIRDKHVDMHDLRQVESESTSSCTSVDSIDREDAIVVLCDAMQDCFSASDGQLDAIETTLRELPNIIPKERVGHWEFVKTCENGNKKYICSCCKERFIFNFYDEELLNKYPYCHCGARMESEE